MPLPYNFCIFIHRVASARKQRNDSRVLRVVATCLLLISQLTTCTQLSWFAGRAQFLFELGLIYSICEHCERTSASLVYFNQKLDSLSLYRPATVQDASWLKQTRNARMLTVLHTIRPGLMLGRNILIVNIAMLR